MRYSSDKKAVGGNPAAIIYRQSKLSRTRLNRQAKFDKSSLLSPAPISLGGRAVGWVESQIDTWLQQQIAASQANSNRWGANV